MAPSSYFESSWAILSSLCLANVLFGLMVINITSRSPVSMIPIVTSSAGALANGLCFYAYYQDNPPINTAVASVFTDLAWLVQEAGITFYSYAILSRILPDRQNRIFRSLFWFFIAVIVVIRVTITVQRARLILNADLNLQNIINRLHVGYFTSLALVECVSAYFLLRRFASGKKSSQQADLGTGLFRHLMRSTEIRLATLALIGTTRAITYYFQPAAQRATSTAGQVDRFMYTLESMFPIMIFIDMLASRIVHTNRPSQYSFVQLRSQKRQSTRGGDPPLFDEDEARLFRSRSLPVALDTTVPPTVLVNGRPERAEKLKNMDLMHCENISDVSKDGNDRDSC